MKLVRDRGDAPASTPSSQPLPAAATPRRTEARYTWKLLVIDDDPDIRAVTRLNLKGFRFDDRELEIIEADSAYQARHLLQERQDIAAALVDVVMETEDAGLKLVEYIRNELKNHIIRLVIRTVRISATSKHTSGEKRTGRLKSASGLSTNGKSRSTGSSNEPGSGSSSIFEMVRLHIP